MTRDFPEGSIRVSDAERDQAIAELSEHFQAGRLTQDEFDDRSTLALHARTGDNLRALFTDLPTAAPAGTAPASLSPDPDAIPAEADAMLPARHDQWPAGRIAVACLIATIVIGNVVATAVQAASGTGHVNGAGWIFPVVILLILLRRMGRR